MASTVRSGKRMPRHTRPRQRGAALLLAMVIVTLVATLAAAMVWQQWRAVQVEEAERARSQAGWILSGALDWARLILQEDARSSSYDHLGEPWAVPLAEARLSTFLAADKDHTDDSGPEAFLSGGIADAQARYNLANLIATGDAAAAEVVILERLCQGAGVASSVAAQIATALNSAQAAGTGGSTSDTPLMPRSVAQLSWLGIDADTLQRLAPLVTLLPVATPLNANTASADVIAAVAGIDAGTAERLVQLRQRTPFKNLAELQAQLPGATLDVARLDVATRYFEVRGRLRLGDRVLEQLALVERRDKEAVILRTDRVALHGDAP
jgi:general secretion pathway protein K